MRFLQSLILCLLALPWIGCQTDEPEPAAREKQQLLTPEEQRTLRFELASDWHVWAGQGTIANDTLSSEGAHSLSVASTDPSNGYIAVRNLTPLTKDDQPTPEIVGFDIWIPSQQSNPWWHGDAQLSIEAPSAGVWSQYLGYRSFNDLPKDQFVRVEFPVPNWIRTALDSTNYTDLRFIIAVNTTAGNPAHYLDNFTLGPSVGEPPCTPVSDNNPCTADECDPATGQPTHVPLAPGALCSDGNSCNGIEACDGAGTCQAGTPLEVDDQNPCTVDTCDPETGVSHTPAPAGTACDDEDACNGAEFCDAQGECQAAPPLDPSDDNPCTVDTCDPELGVVNTPVAAGTSCDDGDVCNGASECNEAGACIPGEPPVIDTTNPCLVGSCDPILGVTYAPADAGTSCDDGDVCNGVSTCNGAGSCEPGTPPAIDTSNPCQVGSCDPILGVIYTPVAAGTSCDDGNACNGVSTCDGTGACAPGTPPELDTSNPCQVGSCDPILGVVYTPRPAGTSCEDGDLCNGAEACDGAGACGAGTPPVLNDNNPCTVDTCDPATGVSHTPATEGTSCDDGLQCNGTNLCNAAGACSGFQPPPFDDGNPCTFYQCDEQNGPRHSPIPSNFACSDGNACNGIEFCDGAGTCGEGIPPELDDGNDCTIDSCDPILGVRHSAVPSGTSCDDGDLCTVEDRCSAGVCAGRVHHPTQACTYPSCDPLTGDVTMVPRPEGTWCDSTGTVCDGAETCDGQGQCVLGPPVEVDDGNPCTADLCDAITGAVAHLPVPAGTSCSDGNMCNGVEVCDAAGTCQAGTPVDIDNDNPCTIGSCDSATGLVTLVPAPVNSPCGDGDLCNGFDFCDGAGTCESGEPLNPDDGNPCTIDSCDPLFGVQNDPAPAGQSCADGDVCNGSEACDGFGMCEAGTPVDVDDDNECTFGWCDPLEGAMYENEPAGTPCGDGDSCNGFGICRECDASARVDTCAEGEACSPEDVCVSNVVTVDPPPIPMRASVRTGDMLGFLYTGPDPVQRDVQPDALEEGRISGLRGRVVDELGEGVASVLVDLPDHSELGYTFTRDDGWFDLAVNGGGSARLRYRRPGALPAQRIVPVPLEQIVHVPDVILVPLDEDVQVVSAGASTMQTVADTVTGTRGTRRHSALFAAGTHPQAVLEDGSKIPLAQLSVRITEYTVGENGPKRMPAPLPPTSQYTLAFEVSVDEAIQLRAESVELDKPVVHHVDNFLGFSTGTVVPVGYFDRGTGVWKAEKNGRVIEIIAIDDGRAILDVDGFGVPATQEQLDEMGFAVEEALALGDVYAVGATLMRATLTHFSTFDYNWPSRTLSENAQGPGPGTGPITPDGSNTLPTPNDCTAVAEGSIINLNKRTVAEEVPVVGVDANLRYDSAHFSKNPNELIIFATADEVPEDLEGIEVSVSLVGRQFLFYPPVQSNSQVFFDWDGLDAYGRETFGTQIAYIRIKYTFPTYYVQAPNREFGFATYSPRPFLIPLIRARDREFERNYQIGISSYRHQSVLDDVASLGGWMLTNHHNLDLKTGLVTRGDGFVQSGAEAVIAKPEVAWRRSAATANQDCLGRLAEGPDGTLYCAGGRRTIRRKLKHQDEFTPWFGTFAIGAPVCEDVTPIDVVGPDACINQLTGLTVGPDGSVYFGDRFTPNNPLAPRGVIRKVAPDGQISFIAGHRSWETCPSPCDFSAEPADVPADEAILRTLLDMRVTVEGTVLLLEQLGSQDYQVRSIVPGGRAAVIDTGIEWNQLISIDMDVHGNLYLLGRPGGVSAINLYRLSSGGRLDQLTGYGDAIVPVPAPTLPLWRWNVSPFADVGQLPENVAFRAAVGTGTLWMVRVDAEDRVFFSDGTRIRSFFPGDRIRVDTVQAFVPNVDADFAAMGTGFHHRHGYDNIIMGPQGLAVDRRVSDFSRDNVVYRRASAVAGIGNVSDEYAITSETDPRETFVFNRKGRHIRTVHTHHGTVLRQFSYDEEGRLLSLTDAHGRTATIERNAAGNATALVGIHGQETELFFDEQERLELITSPDGSTFQAAYEDDTQLIAQFTDQSQRTSVFTYDRHGRLVTSQSFDMGVQSLAREFSEDGTIQTLHRSALGLRRTIIEDADEGSRVFFTHESPAGDLNSRIVDPDDTVRSAAVDGTMMRIERGPDPIALGSEPAPVRAVTTLPDSGLSRISTINRSAERLEGVLAATSERMCVGPVTQELCTTVDYDLNAGIRTTTTAQGRLTTESMDALGRLTELRAPGAPTVRTVFDGGDVTAIIIDPDGVPDNGDERQTSMEYNPTTGHLVKVIDPLTNETLFGAYDGADRPQTITLPDFSQVHMSYDPEGNVASVTPPGKAPHAMSYGPRGRIQTYAPPIGNNVRFFYDLDRRMDLIDFGPDTFGQPNQVDFEYHPTTGQLSTITSPTGVINVGFTNGKMTTLSAPSMGGTIVTSIDYDGFLPTSLSWAGPVAGEVNWTYNNRFLIETETIGALPSTTVNYQYDNDGLVTQAGALSIQRDAASGRVVRKTIGRIRESFQYNAFAELSRQTVEFMEPNGTTVRETLYDVIYDGNAAFGSRDALGRITKKTEWIVDGDVPGATPRPLASRTYDYGYNQEGRPWLESVAVDGNVVSSYSYDDNGNRTSAELSWSQLGYDESFDVSLSEADTEYDSADKLLVYGSKSYSWNNFGQLESMHDSATGETTFYQYDLFGNLLRVDLPDGRAIEYDVDGAGRRVGRRELDADGFEISFRGWIYRDLLRPIAEVDRDGNVVARYVYGDAAGVLRNIDEGLYAKLGLGSGFKSIHGSGRLSPRYILELASDGTITRTLAPITDEFGNVYLVIDVLTGETVQRLEYDIFGQVLFDSLPGAFPFGYGGGLYDSVTGHTRFGARDVEHISGRWFARDPVRFKSGQMNLFLHGDADPLNALDATGLATYRCERPLGDYSNVDTPEDRRNFADVPGNPLYHEYVCVKQGNHTICNGQGPSGGGGGGYINSPGRPTNDQWSMYRCRKSHEDDLCLESCLGGKLESSERPGYSVLPFAGVDCKGWVDDIISECESQCDRY